MSAPDLEKRVRATMKALMQLRDRDLPKKVGAAAVSQVKQNFRKGGIDGKPWDDTYRRRLSFNGTEGKYGPLLSRTNTLMSRNVYEAKPGRVLLKNEQPYALIQNDGGMIRVTAKMKRYFWYRYIQTRGSLRKTKSGKNRTSSYNRGLSREAEFWRGMALKRVNSSIRIPARKFMGDSKELTQVVNRTIAKQLQLFVEKYGKST